MVFPHTLFCPRTSKRANTSETSHHHASTSFSRYNLHRVVQYFYYQITVEFALQQYKSKAQNPNKKEGANKY